MLSWGQGDIRGITKSQKRNLLGTDDCLHLDCGDGISICHNLPNHTLENEYILLCFNLISIKL